METCTYFKCGNLEHIHECRQNDEASDKQKHESTNKMIDGMEIIHMKD